MKRDFVKMQGCGNDYIYFDCLQKPLHNPEKLSKQLSNRNFSIGGDGIVLICPSDVADATMHMFNADGSQSQMCGNAIRCVGKYLYEQNIVKREKLLIETLAGIKELHLHTEEEKVNLISVNMGTPIFESKLIPVTWDNKTNIIRETLEIEDGSYEVTCISMGNPHCVIFCQDIEKLDIKEIGAKIENHPIFPERTNVEFVEVLENNTLKMRVWERGTGETLACGTGTCAAAVAAVINGHCMKEKDIKVYLRGGELIISYSNEEVWMTGPAVTVFEGSIEV